MRLPVYTRRLNHVENYSVERLPDGWAIHKPGRGGKCDKTGEPYLFDNLRQDFVNYPIMLGNYMEFLWQKAEEENMSEEEIQKHLDTLGDWLEQVEKLSLGGIWSQYS